MINRLVFASLLFGMAFIAGSCTRSGCTNPDAVNYDITADEDDGSCILCNINRVPYDSSWLPLVDKKPSSIYYNDTVGKYYFEQTMDLPTDKVCGRQLSSITCHLVSEVPENMFFDFDVTTVAGPIGINVSREIYIIGYSKYEFGLVRQINYPPFYKVSMDSMKVTVNGYITYY